MSQALTKTNVPEHPARVPAPVVPIPRTGYVEDDRDFEQATTAFVAAAEKLKRSVGAASSAVGSKMYAELKLTKDEVIL